MSLDFDTVLTNRNGDKREGFVYTIKLDAFQC